MTDETPLPSPAPESASPITPSNAPPNNGKRKRMALILLVLICIGTIVSLRWIIHAKTHIETDNAFVEARIIPISAKVSGTVTSVPVRDNQLVKQGELLLELDDRDYRTSQSQALAGVEIARNETGGEQQKVATAKAAQVSAQARLDQAVLDLDRAEALFKREVIPKEQLDRLRSAHRIAQAQVREAEEIVKRAQAEAGLATTGGNRAKVDLRAAQLTEANLRLSYTKVYAPQDGSITRKSVEPGVNIQPGQPLMALVPLNNAWIVANYKESQITHLRPGQKVTFTVDAYPGREFTGTVDSIMAGTGAAFSLLPPENASGNYVKVVQRIPVKIIPDPVNGSAPPLRVGMSVVPVIHTGRTASEVLKDLNPFR